MRLDISHNKYSNKLNILITIKKFSKTTQVNNHMEVFKLVRKEQTRRTQIMTKLAKAFIAGGAGVKEAHHEAASIAAKNLVSLSQ